MILLFNIIWISGSSYFLKHRIIATIPQAASLSINMTACLLAEKIRKIKKYDCSFREKYIAQYYLKAKICIKSTDCPLIDIEL
jgi:hypothetical protein